jgi:hypothetical protein
MQPKCSTLYPRQTAHRRPFTLAGFLVAVAFLMFVGSGSVSAQSLPEATALGSAGIPVPPSQSASGPESQPESASLAPAPAYCSPCLYYSGDLNQATGNGLANENDTGVSLSQIFTPFAVPSGHTWTITGMLINTVTLGASIHLPKKAGWSIWRGTSFGVAGTLLFAGANNATFAATGRILLGSVPEYTAKVTLGAPIALGAGTYFLNVMPQCTNPTSCSSQRFYESNVTDVPPLHHHGPANITNSSFWNSNFFGAVADYGDPNSQGAYNLFSFGIVGTCVTSGGSACSF